MKKLIPLLLVAVLAVTVNQSMAQCIGCSGGAAAPVFNQGQVISTPSYSVPSYGVPVQSYGTPVYSTYSAPVQSYGTPVIEYGQPVYNQPVYGQPVYGQPVYGQPVYSQPVYGGGCAGCGGCSGCGGGMVIQNGTISGEYQGGTVVEGSVIDTGTVVEQPQPSPTDVVTPPNADQSVPPAPEPEGDSKKAEPKGDVPAAPVKPASSDT